MDKLTESISPRLNPKRYFWIIVGYYIFTMYLKTNAAEKHSISYTNPFSQIQQIEPNLVPIFSAESSTITDHDHNEKHGIHIFQVDWDNIRDASIIALWIFCAALAKIAFHVTPKLGHIFPESCLLIVVGIIIGAVIYANDPSFSSFSPKTFLYYMLPPIILDAGYFMPGRLFFGNIGTILLFAVIGTIWNAGTIGLSLWGLSRNDVFGLEIPPSLLELLLFSTLISAVDPVAVLAVFEEINVNDILYIVVFGESLLNDAVTIVLYHMFEAYVVMGEENVTAGEIMKGVASFPVVALGGTLVGILWGFLTGFTTKFTSHVLVIEPIFVFIMAYLSYLNAELFHMSGVLAITFCGITMKRYVEANISPNSSITVKYAMKMLSSSSETIIFMFLGVSVVKDDHVWNWWFVIATIGFCTIYRFLGVLWMTALVNRFRLNKLNMVDQFVMSYGGLRGAVSFALVLLIEENSVKESNTRHMFVTTTIAVVFFTVFIQGITIKPFVEWLEVRRAQKRELSMNERLHERLMDHILSVMETVIGTVGQNKLRDRVKQLDETYIRPYLIRDYNGTAQAKILETYGKLEMKDAMEGIKKKPTIIVMPEKDIEKDDDKTTEVSISIEEQKLSISEDERKLSIPKEGRKLSAPTEERKLSITKDGRKISKDLPTDIFSDQMFKPARPVRKISYSRHTLEPAQLEPEIYAKINPVQGRPRRKIGVGNSGMSEENGGGYVNPAFSVDEKWKHIGSTDKPSRRVSSNEAPHSSALLSHKPLNTTIGGQAPGKSRRYSSTTVDRPAPTKEDLEINTSAMTYPHTLNRFEVIEEVEPSD